MGADAPTGLCDCKVGRVSRRRGIADLDRELRRRHAEGASLRDLERVVNERLLRRALRAASADVVGDVSGVYEALAGDDASAGERTEARERLSAAGVDVDALESDFVSYGTVRTHLRDCLDVDTDRESTLTVADAEGTIQWARSRSEGIVERTLDRLADRGRIDAGDLEVTHAVRVSCTECGVSGPVEAFLDGEGCECGDPDDAPRTGGSGR